MFSNFSKGTTEVNAIVIDDDTYEFDYLQSLAIEDDLKVPIPSFINLEIEKDQNFSFAESFFLPENFESDTSDSDLDSVINVNENYTQV